MTKKCLITFLTTMMLFTLFHLENNNVKAQQIELSGPLAGQPAVRHMRLYRRGRVSIEPQFGISLQDPYRRSFMLGGQVQYHVTDGIGIGAWGSYGGLGITTRLTDDIHQEGVTTSRNRLSLPTRNSFPDQIGVAQWAGALQLTAIPLRGKIALFQNFFLDTDFYVFGGLAFVGIEERANIAAATCDSMSAESSDAVSTCYENSQTARSSRIAITGTFGAGINAYFTDFFGLSISWRGLPLKMNESGTDESGPEGDFPDGVIDSLDRRLRLHHMFNIGLVFYLPSRVQVRE